MQVVVNILVMAVLSLMAGFSCQIATSGFRHFHAGVAVAASAGGYSFVILSSRGCPLPMAAVAATICGVAIASVFDTLLLSSGRRRDFRALDSFLVSLAGWIIVQSLLSIFMGDGIRGVLVERRETLMILGALITTQQLGLIVISFLVAIAVTWSLRETSLGLIFRGFSSNPALADNFGISQRRGEMLSAVLGFACAAWAGIFEAIQFGLAPISGLRIWLIGTVVFVVAGLGSFNGLIVAALLISTISHLVAYWLGGEWIETSIFVVLILFLVWRPFGVSGRRLKKVEV